MERIKKNAVAYCIISLICALVLGTAGWFLVGSYQNQAPSDVLSFLFRLFFILTPAMALLALVSVTMLKVKEKADDDA